MEGLIVPTFVLPCLVCYRSHFKCKLCSFSHPGTFSLNLAERWAVLPACWRWRRPCPWGSTAPGCSPAAPPRSEAAPARCRRTDGALAAALICEVARISLPIFRTYDGNTTVGKTCFMLTLISPCSSRFRQQAESNKKPTHPSPYAEYRTGKTLDW